MLSKAFASQSFYALRNSLKVLLEETFLLASVLHGNILFFIIKSIFDKNIKQGSQNLICKWGVVEVGGRRGRRRRPPGPSRQPEILFTSLAVGSRWPGSDIALWCFAGTRRFGLTYGSLLCNALPWDAENFISPPAVGMLKYTLRLEYFDNFFSNYGMRGLLFVTWRLFLLLGMNVEQLAHFSFCNVLHPYIFPYLLQFSKF